MSAAAGTMDGFGGRSSMFDMSKEFNEAAKFVGKAAFMVGGFIIGGYFGSLIFDPFFFPIIHDPTNSVAQALVGFLQDNFSFVHEWIGLTGDGGLLQTPFFEEALAPYMPVSGGEVMQAIPEGLSLDTLQDLSN